MDMFSLDTGGPVGNSFLASQVNLFIGMLFIGSFSLYAILTIWNVAFNQDPLANALISTGIVRE